MGCVLLVAFLSFFSGVIVTTLVDVIAASVGSFAAAAILVLAVAVLSILVVVFVCVTVVGIVVNAVVGIGTIEDLVNCVTGSTKERQSRYEKVNLNKV